MKLSGRRLRDFNVSGSGSLPADTMKKEKRAAEMAALFLLRCILSLVFVVFIVVGKNGGQHAGMFLAHGIKLGRLNA